MSAREPAAPDYSVSVPRELWDAYRATAIEHWNRQQAHIAKLEAENAALRSAAKD